MNQLLLNFQIAKEQAEKNINMHNILFEDFEAS